MFLQTALFCLFSATFVASDFAPPGLLVQSNSSVALEPLKDSLESNVPSEDPHSIRGLLRARQNRCPNGYGQCVSWPSSSVLFFRPSLSFRPSSVPSYARFHYSHSCYTTTFQAGMLTLLKLFPTGVARSVVSAARQQVSETCNLLYFDLILTFYTP